MCSRGRTVTLHAVEAATRARRPQELIVDYRRYAGLGQPKHDAALLRNGLLVIGDDTAAHAASMYGEQRIADLIVGDGKDCSRTIRRKRRGRGEVAVMVCSGHVMLGERS